MKQVTPTRSRAAGVDRRDVLRWIALAPLAVAASAEAAAPPPRRFVRVEDPEQLEPTAGQWKTWLIASLSSLTPPAPPSLVMFQARGELGELLDMQARRGDEIAARVAFWDPQGGLAPWTQILLDKIRETGMNPVRAARALALFHTALADTTVVTWNAKFLHGRPQPALLDGRILPLSQLDSTLPSYPSEHAAIAGAAATVLRSLFSNQTALVHGRRITFGDAADEAAQSRLWAGANYRSDLDAGLLIGQAVGSLAVARGQSDGSAAVWDAIGQPGRPTGPPYWVPTPPANLFPPLEPTAATWKPWLLSSPAQFRAPVPPALKAPFPSAEFLAETNEVKQTVDHLTPAQLQIARFWADNPRESFTPPGHWAHIAMQEVAARGLSTPRAARAMALVGVGLADSAIACWDSKFHYWVLRPITAIRNMAGQPFHDPNFLTPVVTPPFPAYSSGHSTFSGCSAAVLAHLFPGGTVADAFGHALTYEAAAEQAAVSRLYGGIHYRSDNDEGLTCGRHIANVVIERAKTDGAPA